MRRLLILLIACSSLAAALPAQSLEYIVSIADAPSCTMADLGEMLPALVPVDGADPDAAARLEEAIAAFDPELPLTKGRASLVVARGFRVRSSLMFLLVPTARYAFRAMVVAGVFSSESSGGDVLSGVELVDFVTVAGRTYSVAP
ncbi:MAG: hypothetical protein JXM71_05955 [Spirochaetales bacterium]|nr:hypothetical protein [Spirochaetales bacterium]